MGAAAVSKQHGKNEKQPHLGGRDRTLALPRVRCSGPLQHAMAHAGAFSPAAAGQPKSSRHQGPLALRMQTAGGLLALTRDTLGNPPPGFLVPSSHAQQAALPHRRLCRRQKVKRR